MYAMLLCREGRCFSTRCTFGKVFKSRTMCMRTVFELSGVIYNSKRILKLQFSSVLFQASNLKEIENPLSAKMHSVFEVCDGFERQQRCKRVWLQPHALFDARWHQFDAISLRLWHRWGSWILQLFQEAGELPIKFRFVHMLSTCQLTGVLSILRRERR